VIPIAVLHPPPTLMADKKDPPKAASTPLVPKAVHIGGESIADRIVPHIKKIAVMVVLVAVAVSVILVIRWRGEVGKERSTAKLLAAMEVARREVGPPEPEMPAIPGVTPPKKAEQKFPTQKDRAEAVLASLASSGADPVSSYRGALLLDAGKLDEAIAEYRKGQGAAGLEGVMCREGLGIALETKAIGEKDATARQKLLEEALAAFTAMQPAEDGPRRAYALYHQGRIQQTLGKLADAKASFEKAKPLAALAEPTTQDARTNAQLLSAMIERRLASM
jgi:tetratricopeptide (TPR) repeat protein